MLNIVWTEIYAKRLVEHLEQAGSGDLHVLLV